MRCAQIKQSDDGQVTKSTDLSAYNHVHSPVDGSSSQSQGLWTSLTEQNPVINSEQQVDDLAWSR